MKLSLNIGSREFSIGAEKKSMSVAAWLRGDDSTDGSGAQLTSAYQQSTWVYACVSAIAEQVAQIPFRFSRAESLGSGAHGVTRPTRSAQGRARRSARAVRAMGETIVETGPVVELFNRPHPHLNRFQFWELLVSWLQLRGEFFTVPLTNTFELGAKRPEMLAVLSPDSFREDVRANLLAGWRYTGSSQTPAPTLDLLPTDVITDRLANPFDFWRGMSPLTVARLAAQSDYASAQFEKGLMLNNADTGAIVNTEQQANEEQREAILSALRARKRAAGTADRPLFLWGGAKLEKPALSSADMQFLENRKFKRQEICAVFKVPQEIIGFTEDANRSVSDSARLNFVENRIAPLCERLEAALDPFIKSLDAGLWGWFDLDALPIMQSARRERYTGAVQAFGMGVPIDDCSEIFDLGLPDDLAHAGRSYLPFSLQEVGKESPESEVQSPESTPAETEDEPVQNIFAKAAKLIANIQHPTSNTQHPTEARTVCPHCQHNFDYDAQPEVAMGAVACPHCHQPVSQEGKAHICTLSSAEYVAAMRGSVKLMTGRLQKFFFEQRGRVLAQLGAGSNQLSVTSNQKGIEDSLPVENAKLLAKMKPLLLADLEYGGTQLFKEIGAGAFAVKPEKAIEFLALRKNEIENVNRFTFNALKQTLSDGLSGGETLNELTDRVKSVFKDASERRAETIASTETNIAINSGRFDAMKQAKVDKKAWLASNLSGSRATHQQAGRDYADGIPVDQPFTVGGEKLMFPGDPSGSAGNVINCHCTSIAVKGGKACVPVRWLSFEEWAEHRTSNIQHPTSNGGER